MPGPWRKAPLEGPYLEIEIPGLFRVDFLTEQGSWMDWGVFRADQVEHRPDGSYILHSDGSPFFIRCVADFGESFLHIDRNGEGEPFVYRIIELSCPDNLG
jgi:hypothetical protein